MKRKKAGIRIFVSIIAILIGIAIGMTLTEVIRSSEGASPLFLVELIFAVIISYYFMIITHGGGHLVFGMLLGYRFSSFRIGGLMIVKQGNGFVLRRFSLVGTGGQCLMSPTEEDEKARIVPYLLGGVIFNAIFSLLAMLLYIFFRDIPFLSPTLLIFSVLSAFTALTNGIPLNVSGIANDGMNALSLAKNEYAARAFNNQLRMNEAQTRGVALTDMPSEWFDIPRDADMRNVCLASIGVFRANRTLESGDTLTAEREISALLRSGWGIIELHRRLLSLDLIYCMLVNESGDPRSLVTPELEKLMTAMKNFPSVLRTRYAMARLMDHNEKAAEEIMARFEKISKSYPYTADIASERSLVAKIGEKAGQSTK